MLVAEKIMGFVGFQSRCMLLGFRSVQIWVFLSVHFPLLFGCWETDQANSFFFLLGHKLGPEVAWLDEAHEARQDEFRVLKKAHLLNESSSVHNGGATGQVRVLKKKNCPKPNSLPFLGLHVSYYVVWARIGQWGG